MPPASVRPAGLPSVSVVIAVRDGARYLMDALASVAGQSTVPAEVVVVDDGSTDDSAEIAAQSYASARVITQPQRGYAAAVNRGVGSATGDVLAFIDADDLWSVESLACRLACLAVRGGPDAVVGRTQNFWSPDLVDVEAARVRIHQRAFQAEVLPALVVRRDVFRRVGPLDETLRTGAAIDWVSRARRAGVRIAYVDDVVLHRRIHASNMGRSSTDARNAELLRIVRAHHSRHHGVT
jgi:glycosyltransferase involved in cell wall biosynthesis